MCINCLADRLGGLGFCLAATVKSNRHGLPQRFQARALAGEDAPQAKAKRLKKIKSKEYRRKLKKAGGCWAVDR